MNYGIRQKELPEKFATQEYQVLLVAEKYQTGFEPMKPTQQHIHSMARTPNQSFRDELR